MTEWIPNRNPPRTGMCNRCAFYTFIDKTETCWLWTGASMKAGYGIFSFHGRQEGAHRASYILHFGPIPDGMYIDHRCHVPACVNPDHLRLATNGQNAENFSGNRSDNSSGYRGVWWFKGKWRVQVRHLGRVYCSSHETAEQADDWARAMRLSLHTHNDLDRATVAP